MFVHLHVHTENSWFDGVSKVEDILRKSKQLNMLAVAITDHHNVYSWFQMHVLAKKYKIKPIYGIELNIGKHHLTAIAQTNTGLSNLSTLNNLGYQNNASKKITEKDLETFKEGIYFFSGCMKGKIPYLLNNGKEKEAYRVAKEYKELFGGRFAIEIQSYQFKNNANLTRKLIKLGQTLKIPIIPTNDCHYLEKYEAVQHHKLVSMHTRGKVKLSNEENYFKSEHEMKHLYPTHVFENVNTIVKAVETDFEAYLAEQYGSHELPLSMMYYYDDALSLKTALFEKKNYRLGQFMYRKMKNENLTLEKLYITKELQQVIEYAYTLRNKLYKIETDPYYYIYVKENFPIWRKKKGDMPCAQLDHLTAKKLGFEIRDKRKELKKVF